MQKSALCVALILFFLALSPPSSFAEGHKVEVYVTDWCPYCKALETFLKERKIPYTRYNVEHDSEGIKRYQDMGGGGIPITVIDGQMLRGLDLGTVSRLLGIPSAESQPNERL